MYPGIDIPEHYELTRKLTVNRLLLSVAHTKVVDVLIESDRMSVCYLLSICKYTLFNYLYRDVP